MGDIAERIKTWYTEKIHRKITLIDITMLTVQRWKDVMNKFDIETTSRNNKQYDLLDTVVFDQALLKYIDHPPLHIEDSNYFMIYLKSW